MIHPTGEVIDFASRKVLNEKELANEDRIAIKGDVNIAFTSFIDTMAALGYQQELTEKDMQLRLAYVLDLLHASFLTPDGHEHEFRSIMDNVVKVLNENSKGEYPTE